MNGIGDCVVRERNLKCLDRPWRLGFVQQRGRWWIISREVGGYDGRKLPVILDDIEYRFRSERGRAVHFASQFVKGATIPADFGVPCNEVPHSACFVVTSRHIGRCFTKTMGIARMQDG